MAGGYLECESNHWIIGKIPTRPGTSVSSLYDLLIDRLKLRSALTPESEQHARVSDQRCEFGETFANAANLRLPEADPVL